MNETLRWEWNAALPLAIATWWSIVTPALTTASQAAV
jgi:hypothetical protein